MELYLAIMIHQKYFVQALLNFHMLFMYQDIYH